MDQVRVDKWLWSVRIFKSRSIAATACRENKVRIDEKVVKPSTPVQIGDQLEVKKNGINYVFQVDQIIDKRVGAPIAVGCYTDLTPEDELHKFDSWYIGKGRPEFREKGAGRPTKKERRQLEEFKDDFLDMDDG